MSSSAAALAAFDLKSTAWTLTALRLYTAHLPTLEAALEQRFASTPGLFDGDALVLDLGPLREADAVLDFDALLPMLRRHGMLPVAVQGGSAAQTTVARVAGLPDALDAAPVSAPGPIYVPTVTQAVEIREVVREIEVLKEVPTPVPTLVIDKPMRSGQRVYARGGDLVVLAAVSFGAEVIADGHIHVYAPLRGRAIAGARGNTEARILTTCLEPQLVSIAGIYRTAEAELSEQVRGKPAQVRLEGERLLIEPLLG